MSWFVNPLFAQAAAENKLASGIPWYLDLSVAVAVLVVSFFVGNYLGKKLRMPDHGWKMGLILFSLLASVAILVMGPKLRFGIDLKGGVILIYEVDQTQKHAGQSVDMGKLIQAVKERVNPGGQKEVTIREYGKEQIEIIVPDLNEAEVKQLKDLITTTGNLQFRILANTRKHKDLVERARSDTDMIRSKYLDSNGKLEGWWVEVKEGEEASILNDNDIAWRKRKKGKREIVEVLVYNDHYNVNGGYLASASEGVDEKGRNAVHFVFNIRGGQLFGELTGEYQPEEDKFTHRLAVILDEVLCSAPGLQSRIHRNGQITGNFSKKEVQNLVDVLNAGSLPASLAKEPISELYSGPTLGQDTIDKGTRAMIIASILVPLFMIFYYRFCGVVADFALLLNMLMLFAIMISFKAVFTLTGFAGLALTIGMAVDNNVLVFERLREERARGAALRMAIRNGFQRASTTIIDANLTTLIAATVLYVIGTDQVKGFAVPLFIGVTLSMYTSIFVARVIFDVAEKRRWISDVKMMRLIGHTNIDFLRWFPIAGTVSLLFIVMAIFASIERGKGLFDIDFTGGVSVQILLDEPEKTQTVRDLLQDKLPDLAINDAQLGTEQRGLRFVINTSEEDIDKVKKELIAVFGEKLSHNQLGFTSPQVISAAEAEPPTKAEQAQPEKQPVAQPVAEEQTSLDRDTQELFAFTDNDRKVFSVADDPKAGKSPQPPPADEAQPSPTDVAQPPSADKETTSPPAAEPVETKAPVRKNPYAGGVSTTLTFEQPVGYVTVEQYLSEALRKEGLSLEEVVYNISNDKHTEGAGAKYNTWILQILLPPEQVDVLLKDIQQYLANTPIFPSSSNIGQTVAGNTQRVAVAALVASWLCIIIYLWIRFQGVAFGLAAVVALIHDVFIMLGAVAVSAYVANYLGFLMIDAFKINLPTVAAFLTIIGFSVNDTIVIFDRIREVRGKDPNLTRDMINLSTNQTLSRTLLTSFTVLLVVVVLYISGGEAIHGFAFTLIVGTLTGTYSSVYVASPILLWLVGKKGPDAGKKRVQKNDPRQTNMPSRKV